MGLFDYTGLGLMINQLGRGQQAGESRQAGRGSSPIGSMLGGPLPSWSLGGMLMKQLGPMLGGEQLGTAANTAQGSGGLPKKAGSVVRQPFAVGQQTRSLGR